MEPLLHCRITCSASICCRGRHSRFTHDQLIRTYETADPLQDIEALHQSENSAPLESLPVFHGGWVGYFGYDTVRYVEPKLSGTANEDTMGTPDILLVLAEEVVVFDNLRGTLTLIVNADTSQAGAFDHATERLAELELRLAEPMPALSNVELGAIDTTEIESRVEFETQQSTFESWVARIKDYILDGDVMQVVVSQHLMLIDLGRNDVGRVAAPGSVELTDKMVIEKYSHVMHIVSNVTGSSRNGVTAIDALRATLPAGTLSGAPKIRAMEIIDELEPVKRGVYGGAIGYLTWSGDMDTAIAIRTAVIKDGQLVVQAGAGVVADSVPASEWEETLNKARAVLRAAAMVEAC